MARDDITEAEYTEIKKHAQVEGPPPPAEEKKPEQPGATLKELVEANADGVLIGKTLTQQYKVALALFQSGDCFPKRFKTPQSVLMAMQMAIQIGFHNAPLAAMRQIAPIEGTMTIFGDLPLAACIRSGLLESIDEWFVDESGERIPADKQHLPVKIMGAYCSATRRGKFVRTVTSYFGRDEAIKAGLISTSKPKDNWTKYEKTMFKYRARTPCLKDLFSDVLNGVAIAEYDFDKNDHDLQTIDVSKENMASAALRNV